MYDVNYPYKPAKQTTKHTIAETVAACLALYSMGITLFLFGLRQAGVL